MRFTARGAAVLSLAIAAALYAAGRASLDANPAALGGAALALTAAALAILHWRVSRPLGRLARWLELARFGDPGPLKAGGSLEPVVSQASRLARSLSEARAAAEHEARLRARADALWTPERLKEHVRVQLGGRPLFLVANREPYEHVRQGKAIAVRTPASGVVTGLEPILRACGGTWIAHGSGDADYEVVDAAGRLRVPPHDPQYVLKRVWLSDEEQDGYYYGFSNEGLWPLCHIAHTRPQFEPDDWKHYCAVNEKFAAAAAQEMDGTAEPCVLIQDYHYALLPKLIRARRPDARIALFWHIPWPNPEAFDICPWKREILEGLLAADLVGFHTQYHCNNFLDTIDRSLESKVDRDHFAVTRERHTTAVRPFPISIAFPTEPPPPGRAAHELLAALGVSARFLGVGVDRVDYTKGLLERFRGLERLLEREPGWVGELTFVQIAAPSRTLIERYSELGDAIEREVERINARFATKTWRPIVLLNKSVHSHDQIDPYYRAAHVCVVSSLHDGMNLVAKEFVAARHDELGALVLSRFTGAARELSDALIVNPYDVDEVASAVSAALRMPAEEQRRRMSAMRRVVREHNVYRWAARLIEDLGRIPSPATARSNGG